MLIAHQHTLQPTFIHSPHLPRKKKTPHNLRAPNANDANQTPVIWKLEPEPRYPFP
jgi:hypothetical protein